MIIKVPVKIQAGYWVDDEIVYKTVSPGEYMVIEVLDTYYLGHNQFTKIPQLLGYRIEFDGTEVLISDYSRYWGHFFYHGVPDFWDSDVLR